MAKMFIRNRNVIRKPINVSVENRYAMADAKNITLNGQPAKISGIYNQFATVWQIGTPWMAAEFGWEIAEGIWQDGGKFVA